MDDPIEVDLQSLLIRACEQLHWASSPDWPRMIRRLQETFSNDYLRVHADGIREILQNHLGKYIGSFDIDKLERFSCRSPSSLPSQPLSPTTPSSTLHHRLENGFPINHNCSSTPNPDRMGQPLLREADFDSLDGRKHNEGRPYQSHSSTGSSAGAASPMATHAKIWAWNLSNWRPIVCAYSNYPASSMPESVAKKTGLHITNNITDDEWSMLAQAPFLEDLVGWATVEWAPENCVKSFSTRVYVTASSAAPDMSAGTEVMAEITEFQKMFSSQDSYRRYHNRSYKQEAQLSEAGTNTPNSREVRRFMHEHNQDAHRTYRSLHPSLHLNPHDPYAAPIHSRLEQRSLTPVSNISRSQSITPQPFGSLSIPYNSTTAPTSQETAFALQSSICDITKAESNVILTSTDDSGATSHLLPTFKRGEPMLHHWLRAFISNHLGSITKLLSKAVLLLIYTLLVVLIASPDTVRRYLPALYFL